MGTDLTAAKTSIRTNYAALERKPNEWVAFRRLRPAVEQDLMNEGVDITMVRGLFHTAVMEMTRADEFVTAPDSNRKALVFEDHHNAIRFGLSEHHLIVKQIQD